MIQPPQFIDNLFVHPIARKKRSLGGVGSSFIGLFIPTVLRVRIKSKVAACNRLVSLPFLMPVKSKISFRKICEPKIFRIFPNFFVFSVVLTEFTCVRPKKVSKFENRGYLKENFVFFSHEKSSITWEIGHIFIVSKNDGRFLSIFEDKPKISVPTEFFA